MSELFPSQILHGSFALRTYKEDDIHQYPQAISALINIEILSLAADTDYIIDLSELNQFLEPLNMISYFAGGTPSGFADIEVLDSTGTQIFYKLRVSLSAKVLGELSNVSLPHLILPPSCQLKLTPTVSVTKVNLYAKKVIIENTLNIT